MHLLSAVFMRVLPRKEVNGEESRGPRGGRQTFHYSSSLPLAGHAAIYSHLQALPSPYASYCSGLAGCHSLATDSNSLLACLPQTPSASSLSEALKHHSGLVMPPLKPL